MSWADPAHTAARGSSRAPSEGWDMVGMISFYLRSSVLQATIREANGGQVLPPVIRTVIPTAIRTASLSFITDTAVADAQHC